MMNLVPSIIFSVCVWGYFLEADATATNRSLQYGHFPLFQGQFDMSNMKLLHFEGKSYYLGTIFKTSFLQASLFCQMLHMQLVSVHSDAESDRLYKYIMDTFGAGNNFWSSGSRLVDGRTWMWLSTGEQIKYSNWVSTQPDNTNNNERCIELAPENHGLYWNDLACEKSDYFICEKYDNPLVDDVSTRHIVEPTTINPLLSETTPNEKRYRVARVKATQESASHTCKRYGMELANIPDKKTNDDIVDLISRYNQTASYWTSGIKQSDGKWVWWNHQPIAYTNWAPTEPNNKKKTEYCLQFESDGKWYDVKCDHKLYFICETVNMESSNYCKPLSAPTINIYIKNNQETNNSSETSCTCNGNEDSDDDDGPFYAIQPRIGPIPN